MNRQEIIVQLLLLDSQRKGLEIQIETLQRLFKSSPCQDCKGTGIVEEGGSPTNKRCVPCFMIFDMVRDTPFKELMRLLN